MRRFLTLVSIASAAFATVVVPLTQRAGALTTQRYYFHSPNRIGAVDFLTAIGQPNFDTEPPTATEPAVTTDTSALTSAAEENPADAYWTGRIDGVVESFELDLWLQSPTAALNVSYTPTLTVDGTHVDLESFEQSGKTEAPVHIRQRIDQDADGNAFSLDLTGKTVTLRLSGDYLVDQAVTAFFFDSVDYPAGFTINTPADPQPHANLSVGSATFTAPATMPQSADHTEPSLIVAPPGTKEAPGSPQTVYVGAIPGLLAGSTLWRSDDNGATFTPPIKPQNVGDSITGPFGGGDVDIKTDKAGNLFFADLWLGNDAMSVSTDKGESWFGSPVSHASLVTDRQWLGYSADENAMYLTYNANTGLLISKMDLDQLGPENSVVMSQESLVVDDATRGCLCPPGSLTVDDTRPGETPYVYVAYSSTAGLAVSRSDDGGLTFASHVIPGTSANGTSNAFEASAVDAQGRLYVAWAEESQGSQHVFYAWSDDHAETWHGPIELSSIIGTESTALFPAIAAADDGHVAIAFYGTPKAVNNNDPELNEPWDVYLAESHTAASDNPTFDVSLVHDNMHVGGISTQGLGGSADRSLGDFFSIAFDADGFTHLAYNKDAGSSVNVAYLRQLPKPISTSLTYIGATTSVVGRATTLSARLTTVSGDPLAGQQIRLAIGSGSPLTATTGADGIASAIVTGTPEPGTYTVNLGFAGSPGFLPAIGTGSLLVKEAVAFAPNTTVAGQHSDDIVVRAVVTDDAGGTPVTFRLGSATVATLSDTAGQASATFRLTMAPGTYPVSVLAAGRTITSEIAVSRDAAAVSLVQQMGKWTATLSDLDSGAPLGHRIIDFAIDGTVVASEVTDALGNASARVQVPKGSTIAAIFDGDTYYTPAQASRQR